MARSKILEPTNDPITDSGSVLWSIVTGEQLEFPVILNFLEDATKKGINDYVYEAVVIEANNTPNQEEYPTGVRLNGVQTIVTARIPLFLGIWQSATGYDAEDIVTHNDIAYKLTRGISRVSSITPDVDPFWEVATLNKIYIQFHSTLGATWSQKATASTPVYGFFELRVTEPSTATFVRTWKPVRGLVQLLFSPTNEVPG